LTSAGSIAWERRKLAKKDLNRKKWNKRLTSKRVLCHRKANVELSIDAYWWTGGRKDSMGNGAFVKGGKPHQNRGAGERRTEEVRREGGSCGKPHF